MFCFSKGGINFPLFFYPGIDLLTFLITLVKNKTFTMNRLQKLLCESDYRLLVQVTKLYKSGDVSQETFLDTIATMISLTQLETYNK